MQEQLIDLSGDCARCFGLCCVALPFTASADFARDKPAGTPQADASHDMHHEGTAAKN